jgi:hypothetical protein
MKRARLLRGGEVDFKLRRRAAWLKKMPSLIGKAPRLKAKPVLHPERTYGRRSVIKASYHKNFKAGGKWSRALEKGADYMERGHNKEPGHKELGWNETEDRVHIMATAHDWSQAHDRLHWRIILSPDDADLIDVRAHVRKVMAQIERDLGTKLKWVAVEHDNTDHRHAHILIRGVREELDRNGKCVTLTMPREYVSQGIRDISQQLIEKELGPRTEREYLQARGNGIEGERWTGLDRAIERRLADGVADYSFAAYLSERSRPRVQQEMERLAYLDGRGMAHNLGDNRWLVEPDFKARLKELQLDNDIIKSAAKVHIKERERERELA